MSRLLVAIYDINQEQFFPSPGSPVITDDQGMNYPFPNQVQYIYYADVPIGSTQKNSVLLTRFVMT